eukprot:scaffold168919_cov34-Tisochrysis_lutea.AAC.2
MLLTLTTRSLQVGTCQHRFAGTARFFKAHVVYAFDHPRHRQVEMHMKYEDMTSPAAEAGGKSFTFRILRKLEYFEREYDFTNPMHALKLEFLTDDDAQKFRRTVLPYVKELAAGGKARETNARGRIASANTLKSHNRLHESRTACGSNPQLRSSCTALSIYEEASSQDCVDAGAETGYINAHAHYVISGVRGRAKQGGPPATTKIFAKKWRDSPPPLPPSVTRAHALPILYLLAWRYILTDFYRIHYDNIKFNSDHVMRRTIERFTTLCKAALHGNTIETPLEGPKQIWDVNRKDV